VRGEGGVGAWWGGGGDGGKFHLPPKNAGVLLIFSNLWEGPHKSNTTPYTTQKKTSKFFC